MENIKDFIADAVGGGWMITDREGEAQEWSERHPINDNVERILLDQTAWASVGKTRGWEGSTIERKGLGPAFLTPIFLIKWHLFIDHLASGKGIDEALGLINTKE